MFGTSTSLQCSSSTPIYHAPRPFPLRPRSPSPLPPPSPSLLTFSPSLFPLSLSLSVCPSSFLHFLSFPILLFRQLLLNLISRSSFLSCYLSLPSFSLSVISSFLSLSPPSPLSIPPFPFPLLPPPPPLCRLRPAALCPRRQGRRRSAQCVGHVRPE